MYQIKDEKFLPKFDVKYEKYKSIVDTYAPNENQKKICEILKVPYSLWSFYCYTDLCIGIGAHFFLLDSFSYTVTDMGLFNHLYITEMEKNFIVHHKMFRDLQESVLCVPQNIHSLHGLCINAIDKIISSKRIQSPIDRIISSRKFRSRCFARYKAYILRQFTNVLPTTLIQDILDINMVQMPNDTSDCMTTLFDCYPLNGYFTEMDKKLPKDFIFLFQDEIEIYDYFDFKEAFVIIRFAFEVSRRPILYLCSGCFDSYLKDENYKGVFRRKFYYSGTEPYNNNLKFYQNHDICWCNRCLQVPLFKILTGEEYEKYYKSESSILIKWYVI